jgi:hypothetical protein
MKLNSYAQRLLNPFRGVMNIIEHQGAEAVTTDGIHWDIYVRDTDLVEELANSKRIQTSDIRYGSWSKQNGLKRGAIYPSDDFKVLEHRGAIVYEQVLERHGDVPFPLKDDLELWLLDADQRPLALLNSVVNEEDVELDCHIDWRAGQECRRKFASPALRELIPGQGPDRGAGEYLTRYINARAGAAPRAQWFRRNPDGSGEGLRGINVNSRMEGRVLETAQFPRYFLCEDDHGEPHRRLIQDFLAWQAPCLLLLQNLEAHTRERFEQLAAARALTVDKHFRLYPEIINQDALTAARVEAALRKNQHQEQEEEEEEIMSTYYIELNVTRTN